MTQLHACRFRSALDNETYRCHHESVHTRSGLVDRFVCGSCTFAGTSFPQRTNGSSRRSRRWPAEIETSHSQPKCRVLWLLADLAQGGIGTYTANLFKSLIGDSIEATAIVFYSCSPQTTDFALARWLSRFTRVICTDEAAIPEEIKQAHPYIEFRPGSQIYDCLLDDCDVVTTASDNPHVLARTDWRNKPLLVQLHSTCKVTGQIARTLDPYAAHFLVTSPEAFEVATQSFALSPGKVTLIELAVDSNRLASWGDPAELRRTLIGSGAHQLRAGFAETAYWALFFGRFAPEKRIPLIAQAVRLLNERGRPWLGVFVGSGWKVEPLQAEIRTIIPRHHVFLPWIAQIGDVIRASDAFLCTSAYEGGPTTSLEALLAGLPVLSTDVGILPTVRINGPNSQQHELIYHSLGRDPTPALIADELSRVVQGKRPTERRDAEYATAMLINGRFSLRRMAEQWRSVLQLVAHANRRE